MAPDWPVEPCLDGRHGLFWLHLAGPDVCSFARCSVVGHGALLKILKASRLEHKAADAFEVEDTNMEDAMQYQRRMRRGAMVANTT